MLTKAWEDVRAFHIAFGHPAPTQPSWVPDQRVEARAKWTEEELDEGRHAAKTLTGVDRIIGLADAAIDAIYFQLGLLVELGVDPGPLFDIVQQANMAKLHTDPVTGDKVAVYNDTGKVQKPPGWVAPEPLLEAEIRRQLGEDGPNFVVALPN